MNKLYLIIILLSVFDTTIYSQNTSQNQKLQINKADYIILNKTIDNTKDAPKDTTYHHFNRYIFDDKKMKSFFKDALIPSSFPVYDHSKSYLENKLIAKTWGQANKKLIKKELRYKLD